MGFLPVKVGRRGLRYNPLPTLFEGGRGGGGVDGSKGEFGVQGLGLTDFRVNLGLGFRTAGIKG